MKRKTVTLATEKDLLIDLTLHNFPAFLISEFAQKTVHPYYKGNLNAVIQDLIQKELAEQNFIHSHITRLKNANPKQDTCAREI